MALRKGMAKMNATKDEKKKPTCPECPKGQDKNTGSENPGENFCYTCGFQWPQKR